MIIPGVQNPHCKPVMLPERLLHRMQRTVRLSQPFDGDDLGALALQGERGAGLGRDAVDVDHTGTALRCVAADMGAGQPQILAQKLHQERARLRHHR